MGAEQALIGEMHNTPFGYPIVRFHGKEKIIGELYGVTSEELIRIDELEGYDPEGKSENVRVCPMHGFYRRKQTER